MFDRYNRNINYLRISVTDRCNLRCVYCMPEEGIPLMSHNDVLSYEEMGEFVRFAVSKGISKVRITGGEPLVRRGIVGFVEMLAAIDGITDLAMTTNGILLEEFAGKLKQAGLSRVNVSLDTVNPEKYREITRIGDFTKVIRGINDALDVGLTPVKVNCVVEHDRNETDAKAVAEYFANLPVQVRFIPRMDLECGVFGVVDGGVGGNCPACNRLRLTANGNLKPCLFSDDGYSIRELGFEKAMEEALQNKPECGSTNNTSHFSNIGG
ncbi:MAG: radical SAM protein [Bacteroidetes bacterium]|nr:radical SAM protein [Bacteroidota bacterium]MBU1719519.1 radical SAM protein [Bacteroidota bacterium]